MKSSEGYEKTDLISQLWSVMIDVVDDDDDDDDEESLHLGIVGKSPRRWAVWHKADNHQRALLSLTQSHQ